VAEKGGSRQAQLRRLPSVLAMSCQQRLEARQVTAPSGFLRYWLCWASSASSMRVRTPADLVTHTYVCLRAL
jgi:hypothetical protein